jgi:hypothetical protein
MSKAGSSSFSLRIGNAFVKRIYKGSNLISSKYLPGFNTANFGSCASAITTVGSNGGPSAYGTYDQTGYMKEWNDLTGVAGSFRGIRGGEGFRIPQENWFVNSSNRSFLIEPSVEEDTLGFRVASVLSLVFVEGSSEIGLPVFTMYQPNFYNFPYFNLIGDIGNTNDTTGYGAVGYNYAISQYPVTNCEYALFLNAVAATDTYNLYNTSMGIEVRGGINRSGNSGNYTYSVKTNMGNKPVLYISWWDCARYCNWLHNNRPSGSQDSSTTEDGAYRLNGTISGDAVSRSGSAKYHIPTENEWYKAAYYKGGGTNAGYWNYATQNDLEPTCVAADNSGNGPIISDYICV